MAATIILLKSFSDGQGLGASSYFTYAPDEDANFTLIETAINQLVQEVRGVQGPNQTLPTDILILDDPSGIGATANIVLGVESYEPSFVSVTRVDVTVGVALIDGSRVNSTAAVMLSPVTGTDDGGTLYAYIALDINGFVTINTAPGSQALDLWRVVVDGTPEFVAPGTFQKVGSWQYGIDGDAWVEQSDATGLGSTDTFPIEPAGLPTGRPYPEPKVRINRVERLLSGFNTDLQATPQTIGPIIVPGGDASAPGLAFGDGAGVNDLDTGIYRLAGNRLGVATGGSRSLEFDAVGNLDFTRNARVKGNRTATQAITDATATLVDFSAADDFDIGAGTDTWHDHTSGTLSDRQEFTVPTDCAGLFAIVFDWEWAAPGNAYNFLMEIRHDAATVAQTELQQNDVAAIVGPKGQTVAYVVLAATDVIRARVTSTDLVGAVGINLANARLSIVKVA